MKPLLFVMFLSIFMFIVIPQLQGQCSICTKTAQQLGERPAKGMNAGILYLAFAPLALVGIIGFRWWRKNRDL